MAKQDSKEKIVLIALVVVAILVLSSVLTVVHIVNVERQYSSSYYTPDIPSDLAGISIFSFAEHADYMDLSSPSYERCIDESGGSGGSGGVVTPPNLNTLGVWSSWRDGVRSIWWQEGTFRVNQLKMLPRSAGKEGGKVTEIYVYTNLDRPSMVNVWVNEGFYFSLFKFNGIFPQPVDAKAYPARTGGWGTFGTGDMKFYSTNIDFKDEGVYIMAVHLEIDRMTQGGITHEEVDFFTDAFAISNSGGSYSDNDNEAPTKSYVR